MPRDYRNAPRGYNLPRNDPRAYNVAGMAQQVPGGMPLDGQPMIKQELWGREVRPARPHWDLPKQRYGEGALAKEVYVRIKNVGVGGQASCDLYERQSDKQLVVCKTMRSRPPVDKNGVPCELSILKSILRKHPLVIDLLHYGSLSVKNMTFWFEYCSAGDLQDVIDAHVSSRMSPPEPFLWHCYRQLAEAMAYIHYGYRVDGQSSGSSYQTVVHRDMKPSNVFLRRPKSLNYYPDLVIADFGMATTSKYSGENCILGTPIYQPPECPLHSREGDIWAVGACIHALATGGPPLAQCPRGVDEMRWFTNPRARVLADVTSFGYSEDLYNALQWVLRLKPQNRFTGKLLYEKVLQGRQLWTQRFEARTGKPGFCQLAEWARKY
ncbi:MAG: hypothetical protein Q9220_006384 [cf. Caloplaca sp. 1 TL-2023]